MRETPTQIPGLVPVEHKYVNIYKVPVVIVSDLTRRTILLTMDVLMLAVSLTLIGILITGEFWYGLSNSQEGRSGRADFIDWLYRISPWRRIKNYWKTVVDRATEVQ